MGFSGKLLTFLENKNDDSSESFIQLSPLRVFETPANFGSLWVFPNIGVPPKMDGENNGKPYQNG